MKKIKQQLQTKLKAVRLFRSQFGELITILQEVQFDQILIRTGSHEYTAHEIDKIPDNPHFLELYASKKNFTLEIAFHNNELLFPFPPVKVFASQDTTEAHGLVNMIEEVLRQNQRTVFNYLASPKVHFITAVVLLVLLMISKPNALTELIGRNQNLFFSCTLIGLVLYMMFMLQYHRFFTQNLLIFSANKNTGGFWHRNRDAILINTISGVVGTALGIMGTLITQQFILG